MRSIILHAATRLWKKSSGRAAVSALGAAGLGALFIACIYGAARATAADPARIVGPNACAECHKQEAEAWKASHHFKTFRAMPRRAEAQAIADRMGIRRLKSDSICVNCHFTVQQKPEGADRVAGVSCESCHGAGKDWIKVHSSFSGKTILFESKSDAQQRWRQSEASGMLRPHAIYDVAKNCYGCHVVPHEDLVNKGGHTAGSAAFDLVSWSQGEVRHSTWHSKGRENTPASAERKRLLYVVGIGVEVETALRAIAKATVRKNYAFLMAKRVDDARKRLALAAKAAPDIPEITRMVELAHSAGLKLNNDKALTAAADAIAELIAAITKKYDGKSLAALDPLIPGADKYKGAARKPD